MNKKETEVEIDRRLSKGEGKTAVFQLLSGSGVNDRVLALQIAPYADPILCERYAKLTKALVAIAWVELVLAVPLIIEISKPLGLVGIFIFTGLLGGFSYLFVWGFKNNRAWAYNGTILLSILHLPKLLNGITQTPIACIISLLIRITLLSFTWFVRSKLFPDFGFIAPRKLNSTYVFSN